MTKKQLRNTTLLYLQSPELRKRIKEKVCPEVDKILFSEVGNGNSSSI